VTRTPGRGGVAPVLSLILLVAMAALALAPSMTVMVAEGSGAPPLSELPQIKVANLSFSNDNPKEGQDIVITAVLANNGTFDIANVSLTFAYGEVNITTVRNLTVPAKGNRTVEVTWKAVKFTHVMSAVPAVDGVPFAKVALTKSLTVAAKPIGNAYVVFAALVVVLLTFVAAVAAPSVWEHMRRR